ncbi:MAG: Metal-dependent hydrolase, endonuclease/exonuclease/phosphatase family [Xanthobacteraceae bacterium]|jgi:endonuclease/exonuclease/phosphatase family metal-dependent hydrolase|nr:Metal-dependent hydrolase, endonuclease/exonuclease/phosphatase family [Xanthobacteraceae bacterium]
MPRKRRPKSRSFRAPKSLRKFGPLLMSTFRQERKAYAAADAGAGGEFRVASYNVHKCVGRDRLFAPWRTLAVIREIGADVIALQEVDQRFGDRTGLLDLAALEEETGLVPVPLDSYRSSHGWRGNLVLVRSGTVTDVRQLVLPGAEPRGALVVDLTLPAGRLRLIAAHLGLLRSSRAQQVEAILSVAEGGDDRPTLLMGDFNEWRLGRRSSLGALAPAFGPLEAHVASFPAKFPMWSLDRILANPHSMVSHIAIHESPLSRIASDHLPIKAQIHLGEAWIQAKRTARNAAVAAA